MPSRLRFLLSCLFGSFLASVPVLGQPTTYYYQGATFETASGAYSTAHSVTGSFTVPNPLAPNLSTADLRDSLLSCVFSDGVQRRTCADSDISTFAVWTDDGGAIRLWDIRLAVPPIATAAGEFDDVVATWGYEGITDEGAAVTGVTDFGALNAPCTFVPGESCWAWGGSADQGFVYTAGPGWSTSRAAPDRHFPTAVQGAGSATEIFLFADSTVEQAAVFADFFAADSGQFIERRIANLSGGQTTSFLFDGAGDLQVGHIDLIASPLVAVTEIVRLEIPGAAEVPPIGLSASGPCTRPAALLLKDDELDTGLALANGSAAPLTCQYTIYEGSSAAVAREDQITLPPYSQTQEFPLGGLDEGRYNVQLECDAPVFGVSLFQDRSSGGLLSNALQCLDR